MIEVVEKLSKKELVDEVLSQKATIQRLEERLSWFEKQLFGKKSEKIKHLNPEEQILIGFDNLQKVEAPQAEKVTVTYQKEKKK